MSKYDFTIGADPEFCCVDGRTLVESGAYTNTQDPFGCDGNGVTFEVRPGPSNDPLEVVGNIHDIFARKVHSSKEFLKFNWKAGSFYADCPLGGHIHFGIPNRKVPVETSASILDNYVGLITLLIEHKTQGIRRRDEGYGRMGDVRHQDWGFEYRSCSSWLTSPYISAAILCLAKTVMYEVTNNSEFHPRQTVVAEDFRQMRIDHLRELFPPVWSDITKMELYQTYKPYIDLIYFLVNKKLTWFPKVNMKEAWGLVDMSNAYDKIQMSVIWERFKQEIDLNGTSQQAVRAVERPVIHR